ncbi:MAG TPA: ABC transporter substrate-binding protein, partial [Thermoanaerobaculia bacterium]|nr:ABC transporter substrate-binding protein [Thermoanaerobaculia bacterium]
MKSDSSRAFVAAAAACTILATGCVPHASGRAPAAIRISVPYELGTLDPHANGSAGNLSIAANFYEPLVTSSPGLRLEPALAVSWENPDPLTWIFHLRPGVVFHSGRTLRARDVVYSVERLRSDRGLELAAYARDVAEVRAIDDSTVRIRTGEPVTILLNKLQYVFIVPEGSTPETLAGREDGTGPYRLLRWSPGSRLAMTAFDRYWGTKPAFARADFLLARSGDEAIADLVSGRSELVSCNSRRLQDAAAGRPAVRIVRQSSLFVKYLAFDVRPEGGGFCSARPNPFGLAAVRRAVALSIDRERLAATLSTDTRPATQLVTPAVFGFDPDLRPPARDPEEARRLLRESGLPSGFHVVLHTRRIFLETARLVKEMLADSGIDVEVEVLSDAEFWRALAEKRPTFVLDRFACQTSDASEAFEAVVHTADPTRRFGEYNFGGWSEPDLDRDIEASGGDLTVAARSAVLRRIGDRVSERDLI